MALRETVLTCLRERLLNRTDSGPVFQTDEDYFGWILGNDKSESFGLLSDPVKALSATIERSAEEAPHQGVKLAPEEEHQVRSALSRLAPGGISTGLSASTVALLLGSTTFIGPILADGGY